MSQLELDLGATQGCPHAGDVCDVCRRQVAELTEWRREQDARALEKPRKESRPRNLLLTGDRAVELREAIEKLELPEDGE